MITDMYIGPNELDQMKLILDVFHKAYEELNTNLTDVSVDFFVDENGWGTTTPIRDCNGDVLGYIGIGESGGVVIYLDDGK